MVPKSLCGKVIDSEKSYSSDLMEKDRLFLNSMKKDDQPTIHFYDFLKPSFTFGIFIDPQKIMNPRVYIKDFDFSKRPTGGGVLFHIWDFAFSCFVPKNHPGYQDDVMDSYKYINDRVADALSEFFQDSGDGFTLLPEETDPLGEDCKNFCFAKPTKYDIMYGGKKLAGAAQRRKHEGYLHQGSIALLMPDFDLLKPLFFEESNVLNAMKLHTYPLLGHHATSRDREDVKHRLKVNLQKSLNN